MSTPILNFDTAVRKYESEIWRSLAGIVQTTLEDWIGSEAFRTALERIGAVIVDNLEQTGSENGGAKWTH